MRPLPSHQQFQFTSPERAVLLPIAEAFLQRSREDDQYARRSDPPTDTEREAQQLRQELERLVYLLGEEVPYPMAISTPLFAMLLTRMVARLDSADEATRTDLVNLYLRMSKEFMLFCAEQVVDTHFDQFRTEEQREQNKEWQRARSYICTAGMDVVEVLRALYNAAKPQGRGYEVEANVADIDAELARRILADPQHAEEFDYVNGRRMKIYRDDLFSGLIDATEFDRGNGAGAAARAIAGLSRR